MPRVSFLISFFNSIVTIHSSAAWHISEAAIKSSFSHSSSSEISPNRFILAKAKVTSALQGISFPFLVSLERYLNSFHAHLILSAFKSANKRRSLASRSIFLFSGYSMPCAALLRYTIASSGFSSSNKIYPISLLEIIFILFKASLEPFNFRTFFNAPSASSVPCPPCLPKAARRNNAIPIVLKALALNTVFSSFFHPASCALPIFFKTLSKIAMLSSILLA